LRRFLLQTARENRPLLEDLIALHHLGIKQLAAHDDELLSIFVDWFPFETSHGSMPFGDVVKRGTRLHYTPHLDEFRQMAPLAAAHGLTLVNAAYTFDVDVLRAGCLLRGVEFVRLDAATLAARLEDVDLADVDVAAALADAARAALSDVDIDVEVKRFHPQTLAAFYGAPDSVLRRRSLEQSRDAAAEQNNPLADALSDLIAAQDGTSGGMRERPTLAFNWRAPVVRRLAELCSVENEAGAPLLSTALRVLYAQALLLGHHPLGARELEALNGGLLSLVEAGVAAAVDGTFPVQ
jgi:molecular chaperone HtpG